MRVQTAGKGAVAVLLAAVAALGLLNWYLASRPIDTSPIPPSAGGADKPGRGETDLATPLDKKAAVQFQETVGRPLFNPNRKPVQRDAGSGRDAAPDAAELRLVGVMKTGNQPARALIRFASEQTGRWLSEGEEHNGWRVSRVDTRSVVVESAGRSHELTLSSARRAPDDASGGSGSGR